MTKKPISFAIALVAAALAVPTAAGASPALTMPANTLIPTGTLLTGTSTGGSDPLMTATDNVGDLVCKDTMLNFELTSNTGTHIHIVGKSGSFASECTLGGKAATVSEINFTGIDSTKSGSGTFEISYSAEIPGGIKCSFSDAGEPGTLAYTAGSDIVKLVASPMLSSVCGDSEVTGEMTLETSGGGGSVIVD